MFATLTESSRTATLGYAKKSDKAGSAGFRMRVPWQQNAASLVAGTIEGLRVILFVRRCFNLITYPDPCLISFGFHFGQRFFRGDYGLIVL